MPPRYPAVHAEPQHLGFKLKKSETCIGGSLHGPNGANGLQLFGFSEAGWSWTDGNEGLRLEAKTQSVRDQHPKNN